MVVTNTSMSLFPSTEKPYFSKLESVFEKYSASQAAVQDIWSVGLGGNVSPSIEEDPSFAVIDNYRTTGRNSSYIDPLDVFDSPATASSSTISPRELSVSSNSGLEYSPLFEDAELGDSTSWESLFNEDTRIIPATTAAPMVPEMSAPSSASVVSESVSVSVSPSLSVSATPSPLMDIKMEAIEDPITMSKPGHNNNGSNKRKRSEIAVDLENEKRDSLGIIAYNRKPRSMPLQPVVVEEDGDSITVKRARNTEAARRSRARKMERMSQLEERVGQLLAKNNELEAEVARLRKLCSTSSTNTESN